MMSKRIFNDCDGQNCELSMDREWLQMIIDELYNDRHTSGKH